MSLISGNLTSYITSYVAARVDPTFTYETASWIYTGNMVARGVFSAVGGYLEWKIGTRVTAVIGCIAATLTNLKKNIFNVLKYFQLCNFLYSFQCRRLGISLDHQRFPLAADLD